MQELIYSVTLMIILLFLAFILPLTIADRYWGTKMLGGVIKPRERLIYDNRPWWMKRIMMYLSICFIVTIISYISFALTFPSTLTMLWEFLLVFWLVMGIAVLLAVREDRPKSEMEQR